MWLGPCHKNTAKPLGIAWPVNSILALGINFSYDEIVYNKNFEQKLIKMKSFLNLRYPRNLTLYGCITILKSLAISKLIHNTSLLTFPTKFIAMVNQAITQLFVWNKKAKIKHRTMIGPKEQAGLDMPDFQIINETLKVVWVRRLSDSNLQPVGGLFLLQCNFDLKLLKVALPIHFYKEALYTWQKINRSTPNTSIK